MPLIHVRQRTHRARVGATLIEVIAAIMILSTNGLALIAYAAQTSSALSRARSTDAEMRRASAFFDAVALWPREDLDRHLGDRREGAWRLIIERPFPAVYGVTLRASDDRRILLQTELFRRAAPER